MDDRSLRPVPQALPTKLSDHLEHRLLKARRSLNDMVEELHLKLVEDERYISYLNAVYDEQAVEGSLGADNIMASTMIRDSAKEVKSELAGEKLATISKALGVVLRRYGFDRKSRRLSVHGTMVNGGPANGDDFDN